jgi:hypothetical protein
MELCGGAYGFGRVAKDSRADEAKSSEAKELPSRVARGVPLPDPNEQGACHEFGDPKWRQKEGRRGRIPAKSVFRGAEARSRERKQERGSPEMILIRAGEAQMAAAVAAVRSQGDRAPH